MQVCAMCALVDANVCCFSFCATTEICNEFCRPARSVCFLFLFLFQKLKTHTLQSFVDQQDDLERVCFYFIFIFYCMSIARS